MARKNKEDRRGRQRQDSGRQGRQKEDRGEVREKLMLKIFEEIHAGFETGTGSESRFEII
jgi:hypothetical protein